MFPPGFNSKHALPKRAQGKGGPAKPSPGGPVPHGSAHPVPPSGGATSAAKAKAVKPGTTDPLLGLKNALKANQVMSMAQRVAESGG